MAFLHWLATVARDRRTAPQQSLNPRLQSLKRRLLNNPYMRLQSSEDIAAAAALGLKVDVNQATIDDWLRLPGISIHQARLLVELSQGGVPFYCLDDIAAALSIPVQRLKPLEPVLGFRYYDAESLCSIEPVNANLASVELLTQVPAIDLFLARTLVEQRRQGPYRNLADLQKRLSLPGNLTAELMHYLRF